MNTLQVVVVAFLATALAIYFLRPFSEKLGLVDHPDEHRKHHTHPTPLCGGVGVVLGLVIALLWGGGLLQGAGLPFVVSLLPLLVVGLWDDLTEMHWVARMVVQIFCALLMAYWGGVVIHHVGDLLQPGRVWNLGVWAVPLTVFSIVGIINAMNMLDGMDGLAGGVSLMALFWFGLAAFVQGSAANIVLVAALVGAVAGFLLFNFRYPVNGKALVFLGDTGSTILGFALGWLAISLSQGESSGLPPMTVIWILGLPLFDAVTQIIRRLAEGRSPMSPDRNHLHHMLLRRGFTPGQTVVMMWFIALLFGAIGVVGWRAGVPTYVMFIGFLVLFFVYVVTVIWGGRLRNRVGEGDG